MRPNPPLTALVSPCRLQPGRSGVDTPRRHLPGCGHVRGQFPVSADEHGENTLSAAVATGVDVVTNIPMSPVGRPLNRCGHTRTRQQGTKCRTLISSPISAGGYRDVVGGWCSTRRATVLGWWTSVMSSQTLPVLEARAAHRYSLSVEGPLDPAFFAPGGLSEQRDGGRCGTFRDGLQCCRNRSRRCHVLGRPVGVIRIVVRWSRLSPVSGRLRSATSVPAQQWDEKSTTHLLSYR
jgi:hypothetical protein